MIDKWYSLYIIACQSRENWTSVIGRFFFSDFRNFILKIDMFRTQWEKRTALWCFPCSVSLLKEKALGRGRASVLPCCQALQTSGYFLSPLPQPLCCLLFLPLICLTPLTTSFLSFSPSPCCYIEICWNLLLSLTLNPVVETLWLLCCTHYLLL